MKTNTTLPVNRNHKSYWILIACILSLILAIQIRLQLSPKNLRAWAFREIKTSATFDFQQIKFSLSNGLWPEFAIYIYNGTLKTKVSCEKELNVQFDEARLPILSLLWGRSGIMSPRVQFQNIQMQLDASLEKCNRQANQTQDIKNQIVTSTSAPVATSAIPQIAQPFIIQADHVRFIIDEKNNRGVDFNKVLFEVFKENQIHLQSQLHLDPEYLGGEELPPFFVTADGDLQKIKMKWLLKMREGSIVLDANWQKSEKNIPIQISVQQLPVSILANIAQKKSWVQQPMNIRAQWLSSNIKFEIPVNRFSVEDLLLDVDGNLEGDGGKISWELRRWEPVKNKISSAKVNLLNFQIKKIFEILDMHSADGIFSEYGSLSGNLLLDENLNMISNFNWENLQFAFSREGYKSKIHILSVPCKLNANNKSFNLSCDHWQLENSKINASLKVVGDRVSQKIEANLEASDWQPPREIVEHWLMGEFTGFHLIWNAAWDHGLIKSQNLQAHINNFSGKDVGLQNLYVKSNDLHEFQISVSHMSQESESHFFSWFKDLNQEPSMFWQHMQISINKTGELHKFLLQKSDRYFWLAKGFVSKKSNIDLSLHKEGQIKSWKIEGDLRAPHIEAMDMEQ